VYLSLQGNLLVRPAPPGSKSPYNFDIVLLDHGLYFDIDPQLRVNYGKLWLSLIAPASPSINADRRKYAELVGNISPDLVDCNLATFAYSDELIDPSSTPFLKLPSLVVQHLKERGVTTKRNRRSDEHLA